MREAGGERESWLWLFYLYVFRSLGLSYVNWASQECCLFYLRSSLWSWDLLLFNFRGLFPSLSCSHRHFGLLFPVLPTHSSVLAWRIPGTGEPGGLPSVGSHRVRPSQTRLKRPSSSSSRIDWLDLLAVQETLKSLLQHHHSKASVLPCSDFLVSFFFFLNYLAGLNLICSTWDLRYVMRDLALRLTGSLVVVDRLSCSEACGILVL